MICFNASDESMPGGNVYFLSDAHLGASVLTNNRERERWLVAFLDAIRPDCGALYLLGDMFDFWFEYKHVVPKGHVRFLAALARYADAGVPVHFFTGNHDVWAFDYLARECGVTLHPEQIETTLAGKQFVIGHGDGLNPHDRGYLFIRGIFHNRFLQRCFRWLHPDCGVAIANAWSSHSRLRENGKVEAESFRGEENEEIIRYCKDYLRRRHVDYFIFGHRHDPIDFPLEGGSRYLNTGDWITHFTYAVFDGRDVRLCRHTPAETLTI